MASEVLKGNGRSVHGDQFMCRGVCMGHDQVAQGSEPEAKAMQAERSGRR